MKKTASIVVLCLVVLGGIGVVVCTAEPRDVVARRKVLPRLKRELAEKGLAPGEAVFIRIFKQSDELELWMRPAEKDRYVLFRTYRILKWSGNLGPKLAEGDRQAPEGFYYVTRRRLNPKSRFHLSFNIGYPNAFDRHHRRTGSAIMVHGSNVSIGCFAMGDEAIEEIYTLADMALQGPQRFFRVHVFPFRMTDKAMAERSEHKWIDFWTNLKQGYDWFERKGVPPDVTVRDGRYTFGAGE